MFPKKIGLAHENCSRKYWQTKREWSTVSSTEEVTGSAHHFFLPPLLHLYSFFKLIVLLETNSALIIRRNQVKNNNAHTNLMSIKIWRDSPWSHHRRLGPKHHPRHETRWTKHPWRTRWDLRSWQSWTSSQQYSCTCVRTVASPTASSYDDGPCRRGMRWCQTQ